MDSDGTVSAGRRLVVVVAFLVLGGLARAASSAQAGGAPVAGGGPPVFWLDATDLDADGKADSLADGAPVGKWQDKSDRGLAATGEAPPALKKGGRGAKPVVRFDGKDDFLTLPANLVKLGSFTAFVVGRYGPATEARQAMLCGSGRDAKDTRLYLLRGERGPLYGGAAGMSVADRNPAIKFAMDEKFHVHTLRSDAARAEGWLDGASVGAADTRKCSDSIDALWLGALSPGRPWASYLRGDVAEVILYDRALTAKQRQGVEKYLMDKWQLVAGEIAKAPEGPVDAPPSGAKDGSSWKAGSAYVSALAVGHSALGGKVPAVEKAGGSAADYRTLARTYADYMLAHGRDTYGAVRSPVFVSVMDRKTGKVFTKASQVPYPHVKTKPYAPGLRRDHKMRPYDRHYTGANPLEDLSLYKLLYRLSELTGDKTYAAEADKAVRWFLAHAQSPATGLYPWGSHMHWNVHTDKPVYNSGRYGGHEYNFVWPYWQHNPEALHRFARGLWDHQIADKNSGRFSRHAAYEKHAVGTGYEFPQTAACYMDIWARELARSGEPEMKRALATLLKLYRSMRDPKTGAMSWCTTDGADRREVANVPMNLFMATTLQDAAALVEKRDADLARELRTFALEIDDEYLANERDKVLDVAGKGILTWYTISTRQPMAKGFTPPPPGIEDASVGYPLKTADGKPAASLYYLAPWFVNRSYAGAALMMLERHRRCADKHKPAYRRAVMDTADIYMTLEPEIQFVVYPDDIADVVKLLRAVYGMTDKVRYLRRADHMMRLGVRLFFDKVSPLPKISNFDDWYESSAKNGSSMEILRQMVELARDLEALPADQRATPAVETSSTWDIPACPSAGEVTRENFQADFRAAAAKGLAGAWAPADLESPSPDVVLRYGQAGARKGLYLSRTEGTFGAKSPPAGACEIALSDVINKIPTTAEADRVNGDRMGRFTGKEMTQSDLEYAGFKDVTVAFAVVLRNVSATPRRVELTATFHDTYHDNGTRTVAGVIPPGASLLLAVRGPARTYIRKLRLSSADGKSAVAIDSFAVILARRNELGGAK